MSEDYASSYISIVGQHDHSTSSKRGSGKCIRFIDALAIVIGSIVGSGIFKGVQEPYMIFESNDIFFVMLFWLVFGIISTFGGLCYAELGTRIPESGGDRAYIRKIISEKLSTLFVIFFIFVIKTLSLAALSITAASYFLNIFVEDPNTHFWALRGIGIAMLLLCSLITYFSKFLATKTGVVTTALKLCAIVIIIGGGIYYMAKGNTTDWNPPFKMVGFDLNQFGLAMLTTFWAFDGGNTLGLVAGDMKNPARDLPRAIILGMMVVVSLYSLTVISYPAIIGYSAAKVSTSVAYECAKKMMGKAAPIMSVLISLSAFGSATSCLYAVSSASVSAGLTGQLPSFFALVNRRTRTPVFSVLIIFIVSSILTFLNFNAILGYVSLTGVIFYSITYVALWIVKIKTRNVDQKGIFRVPYVLIVMIQLLSLSIIVLSFKVQTFGSIIITGLMGIVLGLQFVRISEENRFKCYLRDIEDRFLSFARFHLGWELADRGDILCSISSLSATQL